MRTSTDLHYVSLPVSCVPICQIFISEKKMCHMLHVIRLILSPHPPPTPNYDYPHLFPFIQQRKSVTGHFVVFNCLELKKRTKRYTAVFVWFKHFCHLLHSQSSCLLLQHRPMSQTHFQSKLLWWPRLEKYYWECSITVCQRNMPQKWNQVRRV